MLTVTPCSQSCHFSWSNVRTRYEWIDETFFTSFSMCLYILECRQLYTGHLALVVTDCTYTLSIVLVLW